MTLKKKLFTFICYAIFLTVCLIRCVLPTVATLESTEIGTFVSTSPVLQDQHLWLKTSSSKVEFSFVKVAQDTGSFSEPNSTTIDTVTNVGGVSPNYSFYNGNISGTLTFTDSGVTVSLSRNIQPALILKNVQCEKKEATAIY